MLYTTKFRDNPPANRSSSSCSRKIPAVPGHLVWVSRGGHRCGSSRTQWSSLPTSCPWFRFWTFLWRRRDQLVALLKHFDKPVPEQVIKVPKLSFCCGCLTNLRILSTEHQTAEQLVEVPTVVSFSSVQRTAEQSIDIPGTRRRRGGGGGLQDLHPGHSCTASVDEQIKDIPVPHGRGGLGGGSLQGFSLGQNSTALVSQQIADFPVPHGGVPDFLPRQGSRASSSSSRTAEGAFDVFFRTFPGVEKVRDPPASVEITRQVMSHAPAHGVRRLVAKALCRLTMMARRTSSRTVTRGMRKKSWRCSTSPSTGSNSLAGVPDASAVTSWQAAVQAGGAARSRMASKSFTRLPFLEQIVDVPVLQITDELLNEAVRGSDAVGRGHVCGCWLLLHVLIAEFSEDEFEIHVRRPKGIRQTHMRILARKEGKKTQVTESQTAKHGVEIGNMTFFPKPNFELLQSPSSPPSSLLNPLLNPPSCLPPPSFPRTPTFLRTHRVHSTTTILTSHSNICLKSAFPLEVLEQSHGILVRP